MKIYIVKHVWSYDGCADDFYNCYEEDIEKIFDCEEKAIGYIQDKIKDMLDACDYYISLDVIPTTDEIKETHEVEYNEEHKEISKYIYETYEVE